MTIEPHAALDDFYANALDTPEVTSISDLKALVNKLSAGLKCPIEYEDQKINVEKFKISSFDNYQLDAVWYTHPHREANGPAVVYCHGGGYLGGSSEYYDSIYKYYVLHLRVSLLSVDYRLAPRYQCPIPQRDGHAALQWLAARSKTLGIDESRIAVMGDSAGGGLAASVVFLNRADLHPVAIKGQYLIYPMLDQSEREKDLEEGSSLLVWPYEFNDLAWEALLGETPSDDLVRLAAPGTIEDLQGLPPTHVVCGLLDIFREDNVKFARRLWSSGQNCSLKIIHGMPHLFDLLGQAEDPDIQQTWQDRIRFLESL